ncbi:MAG: hypothetical protein V1725_00180 [archaeon]
MIDLCLTLNNMLDNVEESRLVHFDWILPAAIVGCPSRSVWKPPQRYDFPPADYEPYIDLWAQFVIEHYAGLDELMTCIRETVGGKHGSYILSMALENAFYHGNQNDPTLPVTIKAFQGIRGVVVRIRDSGVGFDFKKAVEQLKQIEHQNIPLYLHPEQVPENMRFFSRKGRGFYAFMYSSPIISFEANGSAVNMLYLKK